MRRTAMSMLVGALAFAGVAVAHPAGATAWLGVYTQDITPELRDGMNYNGAGALVSRVVPGSPADRGGIERGDVIVRLGGHDVDSPGELVSAVGAATADATVDVTVVREGAKKPLRVRLASRSEGGDADDETPAPRMPEMRGDRRMPPDGMESPDTPRAPGTPRVLMKRPGESDEIIGPEMIGALPDMFGGGTAGRGRLGVRIESLNPDLATYFGSRDARGALVLDVIDGSPAQKAGIRAGDVIMRLDNKPIASADDLTEAVRSSDGAASITLMRHGARQTVRAELGDAPQAMRFRNGPQRMNGMPNGHRSWDGQSPDGQRRIKRIIIDGDDDPRPGHGMPADREGTEQLREEVRQLREQVDQLRHELKSNR